MSILARVRPPVREVERGRKARQVQSVNDIRHALPNCMSVGALGSLSTNL